MKKNMQRLLRKVKKNDPPYVDLLNKFLQIVSFQRQTRNLQIMFSTHYKEKEARTKEVLVFNTSPQ
jgi:hypothetical protein